MKMQSNNPLMYIKILTLYSLLTLSAAQDFDFFYFVQQWPGSFCNTKESCCYPPTGKPASNFSIYGLWPNRDDGSFPSNCDPESPLDASMISDLISQLQTQWPSLSCPRGDQFRLWSHEWEKYGTCSDSELDQHDYFATALSFKNKFNLLQALQSAGIQPNGQMYSLSSIETAIKQASGYTPWIQCNRDFSDNTQLFRIYMCLDSTASRFIECPVFPNGSCGSSIGFPSY